jgi:hypothetical protein
MLSSAWAQKTITKEDFSKQLKIVSKQFEIESYSLKFKQRVLLSEFEADKKPFFETDGQFLRGKNKEYRSELAGSLTIQNNDAKIVIDSVSKLVLVFEPDSLFNPMTKPIDENNFPKATYTLTDTKEHSIYKLFYNSQLHEYESLEFWVVKKSGNVSKIILQMEADNYTGESIDDETVEKPQLIVDYFPIVKTKNNPAQFDISRYVILEKDHYVLTPELKDYTLDDLRYKEKK